MFWGLREDKRGVKKSPNISKKFSQGWRRVRRRRKQKLTGPPRTTHEFTHCPFPLPNERSGWGQKRDSNFQNFFCHLYVLVHPPSSPSPSASGGEILRFGMLGCPRQAGRAYLIVFFSLSPLFYFRSRVGKPGFVINGVELRLTRD